MNPLFEPPGPEAIRDLIDRYPLALLVSRSLNASPLPLLPETDDRGDIVSLLGHCAHANPLVRDFALDPSGLVVFNGPQGYVSPSLVSKGDWAPTWNYAVLRFRVEITFVAEETASAVERLSAALEGDRWSPARLGPRAEDLMRRIIGFRARITGSDHVFKLGQDEDLRAHGEIVAGHQDRTLAEWMRSARRPNAP